MCVYECVPASLCDVEREMSMQQLELPHANLTFNLNCRGQISEKALVLPDYLERFGGQSGLSLTTAELADVCTSTFPLQPCGFQKELEARTENSKG